MIALGSCNEELLILKILPTTVFQCSSFCCYSKPETSDVLQLMTASERLCRLPWPKDISKTHYEVDIWVKAQHFD